VPCDGSTIRQFDSVRVYQATRPSEDVPCCEAEEQMMDYL
jgi:hypothetical protein